MQIDVDGGSVPLCDHVRLFSSLNCNGYDVELQQKGELVKVSRNLGGRVRENNLLKRDL